MIPAPEVARLRNALPFWLSLTLIPLAIIGAIYGGWTTILLPVYGWGLFSILDALTGLNTDNNDPATPEAALFWYKLITIIWLPLQLALIFGLIWYVTHTTHHSLPETLMLFFGVGVVTGTIGINYSHELMHQKSAFERWLADLLLASVLYGHFRSEHLRVHLLLRAADSHP